MRNPIGLLSWLLMTALLVPPPLFADELGRLFLTREQRANLNDIRYQSKFAPLPEPEPAPVVHAADPVAPDPVVSSLKVNGIIRSSRGGGTVWLNNQQIERGSVTREGIHVTTGRRSRDGVQIRLPSGIDTIVLKPGQKIDVATGSVLEAYEADPQADAISAFAPDPEDPTGPATESSTGGASQAAPNPAGGDDSAEPAMQKMLELLRESAGKLSGTLGKAIAP